MGDSEKMDLGSDSTDLDLGVVGIIQAFQFVQRSIEIININQVLSRDSLRS